MIAPRTLFVLRISCVPVTALFTGAAPPVLAQVTTADVVDRPSLRAFVERAHAHAEAQLSGATEQEAYEFFDREFRPEGEWRQGPIYFAVVLAEGADRGTTFFHAVQPDLERLNLWNLEEQERPPHRPGAHRERWQELRRVLLRQSRRDRRRGRGFPQGELGRGADDHGPEVHHPLRLLSRDRRPRSAAARPAFACGHPHRGRRLSAPAAAAVGAVCLLPMAKLPAVRATSSCGRRPRS